MFRDFTAFIEVTLEIFTAMKIHLRDEKTWPSETLVSYHIAAGYHKSQNHEINLENSTSLAAPLHIQLIRYQISYASYLFGWLPKRLSRNVSSYAS